MTQTYDESYHAILEAKYSRIICEIHKLKVSNENKFQ